MYSYRYLQLGLEYSVGLRHKWTSIFDDGTKRLLWYILYFDLWKPFQGHLFEYRINHTEFSIELIQFGVIDSLEWMIF